jgi:dTDP-4-dehydrorhamnose 3,5-epimerase
MGNVSTISVNLPRLIVPKRHVDDRGWFSEIFHQERLRDIGITCRFVQDNQSSSKQAGTLRGLHFQLPPAAQAKLVTVVKGRILDVAVDIRRGSPTFGIMLRHKVRHHRREIGARVRFRIAPCVGLATA